MMTRKMILIAGVAGVALTVPAFAAKPDRGGGQQKEQQQQAQQQPQRGGGGEDRQAQRAERPERAERQQMQQVQRAERPQRAERQQMQQVQQVQRAERSQRAERQQVQRMERPQRFERQVQRQERPQRFERQQQRAERQIQRPERPQRLERQQQRAEQIQRPERQQRVEQRQQQRFERQIQRPERKHERFERNANLERGQQRIDRREMVREAREDNRQQQKFERRIAERPFAPISRDIGDMRTGRFDGRGYRPVAPISINRDMIPMQSFASKFGGSKVVSIGDRYQPNYDWSPVPAFYGDRYVDNGDYYYRYDDDYGTAYQIDRQSNLINASYPLFGGYGIGDPWPQTYYSSYVPAGYRDYYYDTPDYYYRNDGYGIYQVDAATQLITALVSLVMGQGYGIGQALPASYSAYNVPLNYRANYIDDDDSWYRYGDGFIYEVDPRSRVVQARYPLFADEYDIGQRWPVAYPDYNVPYAYRSMYADTPEYQYRYADGGIYRIDPNNQLILALAALVTGGQFAVGQPMPSGYDIYNVPIDYRDRWADNQSEYYRYANGSVYRVDSGTGLIEEQFPISA